jgi:hypothetical protein
MHRRSRPLFVLTNGPQKVDFSVEPIAVLHSNAFRVFPGQERIWSIRIP